MAYCPYNELKDLNGIFSQVRKWERIREPSPGVFYIERIPFFHFHVKDGKRWADARCGKKWVPQLDIPLNSAKSVKERFLTELTRYYEQTG